MNVQDFWPSCHSAQTAQTDNRKSNSIYQRATTQIETLCWNVARGGGAGGGGGGLVKEDLDWDKLN